MWPAEGEAADLLFQTGSVLSANQPYICTFLIVSMSRPDSPSVYRAEGFNRLILVSMEKHGGALLCGCETVRLGFCRSSQNLQPLTDQLEDITFLLQTVGFCVRGADTFLLMNHTKFAQPRLIWCSLWPSHCPVKTTYL